MINAVNSLTSVMAKDVDMNASYVAAVVITGLVVVFLALVLLIILVMLYGKVFHGINKKKAAKLEAEKAAKAEEAAKAAKAKPVAPAPVVEDGIGDEVVAVIAAAVAAMGAESGKKLAVRSVKTSRPSRLAWSSAGLADNTKPF